MNLCVFSSLRWVALAISGHSTILLPKVEELLSGIIDGQSNSVRQCVHSLFSSVEENN